MSPTTPSELRVRAVASEDGERPLDVARLAASIARALDEAGDPVEQAAELAQVVVRAASGPVVTRDELARLVESVLTCAGAARAGARYRAHRERRGRARARLRLVRAPGPGEGPDAAARAPALPWSRRTLLDWLVDEAATPPDVARAVVDEVERGVLASGLAAVSEALLREWVDDVLAARGERARLGARARWTPGETLLREATREHAGAAAERAVLDRALAASARAERLGPALREAHASGALVVEALARPTRWLRLVACGVPDEAARVACGALVAEQLVVAPGPDADLAALAAAWPARADAALVLELDEDAHGSRLEAMLATLARAPRAPLGVVVRLGEGDAPRGDVRDALLRREQVDARVRVRTAGAAGSRPARRRVSLNLPRLVLEHGAGEAALARAEALAALAVAALDDWARTCAPLDRAIRREAGAAADGVADELGLVGLVQALVLARAERGPAGADAWLGRLARRLRAAAAAASVPLVPAPASRAAADEAGRRDLPAFPAGRRLLSVSRDRSGYRYDVGAGDDVDPAALAAHVAAFGLREVPVPRTAGSLDRRRALIRALETAHAPMLETTCD